MEAVVVSLVPFVSEDELSVTYTNTELSNDRVPLHDKPRGRLSVIFGGMS